MDKYSKSVLRLLIKCQYYDGDELFIDYDSKIIRPVCSAAAIPNICRIDFSGIPDDMIKNILSHLSSLNLIRYTGPTDEYISLTHEGTVYFRERRKQLFLSFVAPSLIGYLGGSIAYHVESEYQLLGKAIDFLASLFP